MASTYELIIYIEPALLAGGQVAYLNFANVINGVSKVIFQTKDGFFLSAKNTLGWKRAYRIAATETPSSGTLVEVGTTMQDIAPNTICDWLPDPQGKVLQDMPPARAVRESDGWSPPGSFGTKNLPSLYKNTIWCATADANYQCIFVDNAAKTGLQNRSYLVENKYKLGWTDQFVSESVLCTSWSALLDVEYGADEMVKWGRKTDENGQPIGEAMWFRYGIDPGKHDPPLAIVTKEVTELSMAPLSPGFGVPVKFQYSYADDKMPGDLGAEIYSKTLTSFLEESKPDYLRLDFNHNSSEISMLASLNLTSPCYQFISGTTSNEKTICVVQSLLQMLSLRYLPFTQITNFAPPYNLPMPAPSSDQSLGFGVTFATTPASPPL